MEKPRNNPVLNDIDRILHGGLKELTKDEHGLETAPERIRIAYSESWQQLHDYLFEEEIGSQSLLEPRARILAVVGRLFAEEDQDVVTYATFGLMGHWKKDSDDLFAGVIFSDQPEDRYLDKQVHGRFEEICEDGDFTLHPDTLATLIMNYTATIILTRSLMPSYLLSYSDEIEGLERILDDS